MKIQTLMLFGSILISAAGLATEIPNINIMNDRIEVEPGIYGITHTENFEYVCNMEVTEGSETVKFKTFLDENFAEGNLYRFAVGFVGGGSVMGMVGAEANVVSSAKGRCPGLCLSLTIKSSEDGSLNSVEFQEDAISKIISIKTTEKGVSSSIGTCEKNEVE